MPPLQTMTGHPGGNKDIKASASDIPVVSWSLLYCLCHDRRNKSYISRMCPVGRRCFSLLLVPHRRGPTGNTYFDPDVSDGTEFLPRRCRTYLFLGHTFWNRKLHLLPIFVYCLRVSVICYIRCFYRKCF